MWLLCSLDEQSQCLVAIGTCFAVSCPSAKKIVTAFHNIAFPEPDDRTVNLSEPYYIVRRLHYGQKLQDGDALEVAYNGCGDYDRNWAVLDVVSAAFAGFEDALPLRDRDNALPLPMERSLRLITLYYKTGLRLLTANRNNAEVIAAMATQPIRVDHVYSKFLDVPTGLGSGSSGAPMLDEDECVVAVHSERIVDHYYDVRSRDGHTIFNVEALRTAVGLH